MGLRERKAQTKRERILQEGVRLFAERGFDQTTMEAIAEACELSLSTLYRSFATKDLIVLGAFAVEARTIADLFEAQPKEMPAAEALGAAIAGAFSVTEEQRQRVELLRSILDQTPVARARLFDLMEGERERLARLLGGRLGLPEEDLTVVLAARMALLVAETAADHSRPGRGGRSPETTVAELLELIEAGRLVLPRPARR